MNVRTASLAIYFMLHAITMLSGCQSNRKTYAENGRLRSEVIQLKDQVQSLQRRNDELTVHLQQASMDPQDIPAEILAVMPVVTEVTVGRLSFARDDNGDGIPDALVIYVHPTDGLSRFTQLAGPLSVTALVVQSGDEPPITIGRVSLTPLQVRDAYRSSITGPHYTVEIPIETLPLDQTSGTPPNQTVVLVSYEDGATGRQLTAERTVGLHSDGLHNIATPGSGG